MNKKNIITKIRNYTPNKHLIFLFSLILISACNTHAKKKTTLDRLKAELKKELHAKKSRKIVKLPFSINELLTPKINNTTELDPIKSEQLELYKKFNINANKVNAREFFLSLVNNTKINIVVHPEVKGLISLSLKNVTINQVLAEVQKIYGFGFEYSNLSIRIFPVALQTKVFQVNYLDLIRSGNSGTNINFSGISNNNSSNNNSNNTNNSNNNNNSDNKNNQTTGSNVSTSHSTNVWEQLKNTIEAMLGIGVDNKNNSNNNQLPNKNVAISPTTGMIIVTAYPNELDKIEEFLNTAENTLNKQVMLEAKVLEVVLKDGYRSGINWALLNKHMNMHQIGNATSGDLSPSMSTNSETANAIADGNTIDLINNSNSRTAPLLNNPVQPFGGLFTLGMNYRKLAAFVELLSAQGNVQVLSSPRITTSNNQKALIKVGEDQYFITGVSNNQSNNNNGINGINGITNTQTVNIAPFFSGIALDVTPQIGEDDITLHIHPIISDVADQSTALPGYTQEVKLAKSSIRESDSIIRAKNGQLIIIGGLMKDKTAEVVTGIPFFKDLPFIGTLFRHTRQDLAKSELVILLRPIILHDYTMKNQIQKVYKKINDLDRGFHFGGENTWYETLDESKE